MLKKLNIKSLVFIVLFGTVPAVLEASPLSNSQIQNKLSLLRPLPKVHYSVGLRNNISQKGDVFLYQISRITHAVCFSAEWVTETEIANGVYACSNVNKDNPEILSRIGLNFSPWHRKFGKDLPPTNRGPSYYAELDFFRDRMQKANQWVNRANEKYDSNIKVGAVLLDCERFCEKANDKEWNEGMREAVDAIHMIAKEIFPDARIEWYGRSMVKQGDVRWEKSPYFTGKEILTTFSCSFYSLPEIETMREKYRKTVSMADEYNIEDVTVYIALAAGFRRGIKKSVYWDNDWDYDLIYSYMAGAELNVPWYARHIDAYAPYDRCKIIVFYPPPFHKDTPEWGKHFIAYVRGATGIKDLNDIGFYK